MALVEPTHWPCRGRCERLIPVMELDGGLCRSCLRRQRSVRSERARAAKRKWYHAHKNAPSRWDKATKQAFWQDHEVAALREACAAEASAEDLARQIGRTPEACIRKMYTLDLRGLKFNYAKLAPLGTYGQRPIWTDARIAELRDLRIVKKMGPRAIARYMEVKPNAVAGAIHRYLKDEV